MSDDILEATPSWHYALLSSSVSLPHVLLALSATDLLSASDLVRIGSALLAGAAPPDSLTRSVVDAVDAYAAQSSMDLEGDVQQAQCSVLGAVGDVAKAYAAGRLVSSAFSELPRPADGRFELRRRAWEAAVALGTFAVTKAPKQLGQLGTALAQLGAYRFGGSAVRASVSMTDFVRWAARMRVDALAERLELAPAELVADTAATLAEAPKVPRALLNDAERAAVVRLVEDAIAHAEARAVEWQQHNRRLDPPTLELFVVRAAASKLVDDVGDETATAIAKTVAPEVFADYDPDPDADNAAHTRVRAIFAVLKGWPPAWLRSGDRDHAWLWPDGAELGVLGSSR